MALRQTYGWMTTTGLLCSVVLRNIVIVTVIAVLFWFSLVLCVPSVL